MAETILRFLVVEDEILIAMSIEMELKRVGYTVCKRVTTGEDAVEYAEQHNPDFVLMDVRLAGKIDGIEAAAKIMAIKNIPVVFMTGYDSEDVRLRAMKLNPLGFLSKPVMIEDIRNIITQFKNRLTS